MRPTRLLTALLASIALLQPCALATDPDTAEPLTVFLQGSSAGGLRELVEANGGTVTHDLPIIDAVGAILTPAQLDTVIKSPLITRYFDDLAMTIDPEEAPAQATKDCDVAGSLELDVSASALGWRLFNKRSTPARLTRLELGWPPRLGTIEGIRLGTTEIAAPAPAEPGQLVIDVANSADKPAALLHGQETLAIDFKPTTGLPGQQSDFEITAEFAGDCIVELMPAYEANHENFYYNSVAGVEALHQHGVTGKDVTVAVIDSGLWEHPALVENTSGKNRILAHYDAINNTEPDEVFDASGHGTHMSSVIAHSGPVTRRGQPTGAFKGAAPDVNLVSVKAFDVAGQGDFLDIVRAVQWVVDNREKYNIKVLNLSFSARPRWHYWMDPINQAVMRAWAAGITVVAAAGNEGPEPMTIGSPGNLPYIITVGAITDAWTPDTRDDDYIPDFSSRGPTPNAHIKPDIVAPGGHITGITRPGSGLTEKHPEYILRTGEFVMTGSSQASALVSGVVALLLQLEPDLTPDDVKCKLISSAEPAINRDGLLAYSPFEQGYGQVNASRAVTLGERGCGNPELDIERELAGGGHFTGPAILDDEGNVSLPGLNSMVSAEPSEKGYSDTRRWGVKAHIEREPAPTNAGESDAHFDWMELYLQERSRIEGLSQDPPP